jgi:hypothetical protein
MHATKDGIVADGEERYRQARDYKAIRALVLADVSKRHENEKARCYFGAVAGPNGSSDARFALA